ncbi:MAG: PAS domain S-box protein, partial [Alphaproteobacteria bacterium]|nr:PAS domain S-box protein [Alphaproteobacteria bacterium]
MSDRGLNPSADAPRPGAAEGQAWSSADLRAFALIDVPVWIHAADAAQLLWGNQAASRFWGHGDPASLAGRALSPRCAAALQALGEAAAAPAAVLYPDGRPRAMHCAATRIDFEGVPAVLVHARPAERPASDPATLRALQALQHADLPVSLYDVEGWAQFRNPAAELAFGRGTRRGATSDLAVTFADPGDLARLRTALAESGRFSAIVPVCTASGVTTHLVDAKTVLDPAHGAPLILVSQRDCTMQVAIEDRLRQTNAELARMTTELQQSEARLRDFAVCGSDWFYELDAELRFSYLSDILDSVTGEDRGALIGQRPTREGLLEVDDAAWAAHMADLEAHRPIRDFRFGRATADGRTRVFSVNAQPIRGRDGAFGGYRGVGRDVTAAVEAERFLRAVLDAFPGAVNVKTADRRFVFMNAFQAKLHGIAAADATGKTVAELHGAAYDPANAGNDVRVLATGEPVGPYLGILRAADGKKRDWLTQKVPLKDFAGRVTHIVSAAIDITEQKETERALEQARAAFAESEARFRDFAGASSDWFWEQDENLRFTFVSLSTRRTPAVTADNLIGKTRRETNPAGVSDARWAAHEADLAARRPFANFEFARDMPDGTRRHLSVSGVPVFDASGTFKGYRGTGTDITAQVEAEEAARASEARFRDFAETASDWFWETDAEHRFTFLSDSISRITGISPEAHYGKRRSDFRPTEDRDERAWAAYEAAIAARAPIANFRLLRVMPDGRRRHLLISGKPYFDGSGNFAGYRGTGADVTKLVEAENALRTSEQRFRDFASATGHYVWESDADDRLTFIDEGYERIYGVPGETYLGTKPSERPTAAGRDLSTDPMEVMRAKRLPFKDVVVTRRHRDGRDVHLSMCGKPIFDDDGTYRGYRGTGSDVTALVEAERALKASERRFRDFASAAGHYVWESDADGRLTFLGEGYERVVGIPRSEVLGTRASERAPDAGRDKAIEQVDLMRERREPFMDLVVTRRRRDGRDVHISVSGKPIFDADGTFKGYRGVNRDVTDLVNAQAALKESEQRFRDFASAAGHWVWETDAEDRVTVVGEGFEHVTGVPGGAVIGKRAYAVDRNDPHRTQSAVVLKRAMRRREPFMDVIIGWSTKDGKPLSLALSGKPVFDGAGAFRGFRGVTRDVTAQIAAEGEAER